MAINLARWEEGFDLVQRSLERSAADGEPPRAPAFSALALAALVQSRPEDARRFGDEAAAVARAQGDPFELAEALSQAGLQISLTSNDPRGPALADESLDIARALGNEWAISFTMQAAGTTRYRTDPARAIVLLQAWLDFVSERDVDTLSLGRFMKAFAHLALRDEQSAAIELLEALPGLQEAGFEYYLALALGGAALLLRRRGRPDVAVRLLALNERLRDDGRILGAPRDLESQEQLAERLEREIEPDVYAALWSEGRAMTLDRAVTLALEGLAPIADAG
jgi:hypothetical protein